MRSALIISTAILFSACHGGESTGPAGNDIAFVRLSAGTGFTCGLTGDGTAYCWGRNDQGQLGDGTTEQRLVPTKVATSIKFTTIASGQAHSCALTGEGVAYCWGQGHDGQLGSGSFGSIGLAPASVSGTLRFISIAPAVNNTCATTSTGDVYCWGRIGETNSFGDALAHSTVTPERIGGGMVAVVAGTDGGYCSVDAAALAYCWGAVLFYPQSGPVVSPIGQPASTSIRFATVRRGVTHYCGVATNGGVYCWGNNASSQVGIPSTGDVPAPALVSNNLNFVAVAAGGTSPTSAFSCGLSSEGQLSCWGANNVGQLGIGSLVNASTPQLVGTSLRFSGVRAGADHACALTANGVAYCWGNNDSGQLGNGTTKVALKPAKVSGL